MDNEVKPILKWVGGKRQLLPEIDKLIPDDFDVYYEPFVGGAAVLLHIQPKKAVINDINTELINVYKVVKTDVYGLIESLKKHKNEEDYFYELRGLDRTSSYDKMSETERASRTIYLNKTCYNGLYRVNQSGQFNTPFGKYKNPNIVNEKGLLKLHNYFQESDIEILNLSFEQSVEKASSGDFVYFDPPYDPVSETSNFTNYSSKGFDREDQKKLKEICDDLDGRGVKFLLSNSATPFVKNLYKEYNIVEVDAKRSINSNASKRGTVQEVLVYNYD